MEIYMDQCDLNILAALEDGLPLVSEPFEEIGKKVGLNSREVLERCGTCRSPESSAGSGPYKPASAGHHSQCPCCMGLRREKCP